MFKALVPVLVAVARSTAGKAVLSAAAGAVTTYVGHWLTGQQLGQLGPVLGAGAAALYHAALNSATSTPPAGSQS